MTTRRKFLLALATLCASHARAQAPERTGKPVRVGIFSQSTQARHQIFEKPFFDAMRELGWVEGRNIIYDRVYAEEDEARLPALAAALVSRSPDLIHVPGNQPALAIYAKTRMIPIVFCSVSSPVEIELVKSFAHPGGNVTGVANIGWELGGKRLQLLKQALPNLSRAGVLTNPDSPQGTKELKLIEQAAALLRVNVIPVIVKQASDLDTAFASLAKNRVEAVLSVHIALFITSERKRILEYAAKQRIPVVGPRSEFAEDGGFMSYSAPLADQVRRSAQLVDKILKGAKPADIPVEQPTKFELVVNMKTAKALGIKIPGEIMLQATRVIE